MDEFVSTRATPAVAIVLATLITLPTAGWTTEARRTPDERRTLVSTDIGDQRWAITWNDGEDGTITGNVFSADGGAPVFLWCEDVSEENGEIGLIDFSCFAADSCLEAPCRLSDWSFVQDVSLPRSFFDAPNLEWLPIDEPVTLPLSFLNPPEAGSEADRASGTQVTLDDQRILINKDVGRQRWAITWNLTDRTLTGNIFSAAGADAGFVWCEELSFDEAADEATYSCFIPGSGPPPPTPTPTPTPEPPLFSRAVFQGSARCDKFELSFPNVFTHLNPLNEFRTCWVCPDGFDRANLQPIEGNRACNRGGFIGIGADFAPARRLGEWGCSAGQFENGRQCWRCPSGYTRNGSGDPTDSDACRRR